MTVNEAAARLDVTPVNVRNAIARGALRATKHGRDWWIDPREVDRYARENRYGTSRSKEAQA
ncbi:MAG: helix-turn-helix domain-containing protein [Chloroflexi bacterium]|nr:helix-turn-helix domain-containing protein [Chloroflexota bacterium]